MERNMPFDQFLVLFCALSTCFTTLYSLFLSITSNLKASSVPTNIFPKLSSTALHLLFIALNCMTLCPIPSSVCWMACQKVGWPSRIGNSWVHTADCLLEALIWVSLSYLEACFHENLITWGSSEIWRSSVKQAVDWLRAAGPSSEEKPPRMTSWWESATDHLIRRRKWKKSFWATWGHLQFTDPADSYGRLPSPTIC